METQALRRSDELKTALLRTISHDLRTPLTAILTAGLSARRGELSREDREELGRAIVEEAERSDGARGEAAGPLAACRRAPPSRGREWCSVDEILREAADGLDPDRSRLALSIDPDLPLIRADAAQLERAFANLLENAMRYSGDERVSVRARVVGQRLMVRVVDRGPGIARAGADADLRGVLSRSGQALRAHRVGARAGDREGFRRGQRRPGVGGVAAGPGHELRRRAAAGARRRARGGPAAVSRRAARARLRRRAAYRPRAEDRAARSGLRGAAGGVGRGGAARREPAAPGRGDPRPRAARRRRRRRSAAACGSGARCRSWCCRRWATRTTRCARWRPVPTTT